MNNHSDVLILGAGLAGLYAAKLLRQKGLTVTVLEARNRLGGRATSQVLENGVTVDLGAQWISPDQKRIWGLAEAYQLNIVEAYTQGEAIVQVGGQYRTVRKGVPPLSKIALLDVLQIGWRLDRLAKQLREQAAWKPSRVQKLDSLSCTDWLKRNTFTKEGFDYWRHIVVAGTCANSDTVSPFEIVHQIASVGGLNALEKADTYLIEGGVQRLVNCLANEIGDCVECDAAVRSLTINQSSNNQLSDSHSVRAITKKGDFFGKRVIFALPPQLIETIAFDPVVEEKLGDSRSNLVLGKVVKNLVVYERPWWREKGFSGMADTPEDLIGFVADSTKKEGAGVLAAFANGDDALKVSQLDAETRRSVVLAHIHKLFGESTAQLTGFVSMDWITEPWSLGGYASRRGIGGWTTQPHTLSEAIGPIHFAGTETATEWRSYMEGALQSAERASEEVVAALKATS